MCPSNLSVTRRLHHRKLIRREIHMKRMTLLTALALVLSLFTVTAAIAAPGEGTGDALQAGDTLMAKTHTNGGECQATDDCPAGAMVMTRTQTQSQTQAGECLASDECPSGDQTKTQTKEQTATQAGECQADDCAADEAPLAKLQMRERLTERILAMLGAENADVEGQYRLILNLMLQNTLGFRAMFI